MCLKKIKHKLFISKIPKIHKIYFLPFILALWGILNVFYWEVYKGYKACAFCKWHRGLYFGLFISLLCLVKFRKCFFKLTTILIIFMETIVGFVQVFGANCNPMICRRVTMPEKINFSVALGSLILVVIVELYYLFKLKKRSNSH